MKFKFQVEQIVDTAMSINIRSSYTTTVTPPCMYLKYKLNGVIDLVEKWC